MEGDSHEEGGDESFVRGMPEGGHREADAVRASLDGD